MNILKFSVLVGTQFKLDSRTERGGGGWTKLLENVMMKNSLQIHKPETGLKISHP